MAKIPNRFAFVADTHLKPRTWSNRREVKGDTFVSFNHVVDYCLAHGLALILGGDILDSPKPTSETVEFLLTSIRRMNMAGLEVLWIDGNHDRAFPSWGSTLGARLMTSDQSERKSPASSPFLKTREIPTEPTDPITKFHSESAVSVGSDPSSQTNSMQMLRESLESDSEMQSSELLTKPSTSSLKISVEKVLTENGTTLVGINNLPMDELKATLESLPPDVDIVVCHQLLDLACPMPGMWNMKAEWVPPSVRMVLMGDYHVKGVWYHPETMVPFYYPGSTAMMSFSESPHKFFYEVDVSDITKYSVTAIQIPTRQFYDYIIKNEADMQQFISDAHLFKVDSDLPEEIATPLIRVRFDPHMSDCLERLSKIAGDECHLYAQPIPAAKAEEAASSQSFDPEQVLQSILDREKDPQTFELVMELYRTGDPGIALQNWRGKLGIGESSHGENNGNGTLP